MKLIGQIEAKAPYDLSLLLQFLSHISYPTLDRVFENAYRRVIRCESGLALVEIRQVGPIEAPVLEVYLLKQSQPCEPEVILNHLKRILSIDQERSLFFKLAQTKAELWQVVEALYGMPILLAENLYEALIITIIEQQISWKSAQKAQLWLIQYFNHHLEYEGEKYYAFPTIEDIAMASVEDLKPLKITYRRMQLMISISQAILKGELDLEALYHLEISQAYGALMEIKGIGHWTATVSLDRALGPIPYIAHNDVALQAAVAFLFHGEDQKASEQKVIETFQQYEAFSGWVAAYTIIRWVIERY